MAINNALIWDKATEHFYETGVDKGALYLMNDAGTYDTGVVWNGLTAITEQPSGAEATAIYADNIKYLNLYSAEEFGATVEAYTYPDEFAECDGSVEVVTGAIIGQQPRKTFGLAYRTKLGNDAQGDQYGYKLHLIYGCKASPSERAYNTINDSPEAITFSWEVKTTPVNVTGQNPTSNIVIDSTKVNSPEKMAKLEAVLFGVNAPTFSTTAAYKKGDFVAYTASGSTEKLYQCTASNGHSAGAWSASDFTEIANAGPRLPLPAEVITLLS